MPVGVILNEKLLLSKKEIKYRVSLPKCFVGTSLFEYLLNHCLPICIYLPHHGKHLLLATLFISFSV